MNIGFDTIDPTYSYPNGVTAASLSVYPWDSDANVVTNFKAALKDHLRDSQFGRCCYCRRALPDPEVTDLEHFVEKSAYSWLKFEIRNLALSCRTCNTMKNAAYTRFCARRSREETVRLGTRTKVRESPTLAAPLAANSPLPAVAGDYLWVHPHFDRFSDHLVLKRGWIYVAISPKGEATKRELQFNELATLERRAMAERLAMRGGRLSLMVSGMAELNNAKLSEVCVALAREIRVRKRQTR